MNEVIHYLEGLNPLTGALISGVFTWLITALGASLVFFFNRSNRGIMDAMLGFAGGVMLAASFWSLLNPAIDMSKGTGFIKILPIGLGFFAGAMMLFLLDKVLPHLHLNFQESEGMKTSWHRTTLLVLAITLHNIPEGLAIGVLFGGAASGVEGASISGALALAIGIGIQNFPEGFAVSMPLRRQGLSRLKSFWYGQLSAIVEPVAAVFGAWVIYRFQGILPIAMSFAAGAMIFVVVEEVIPETQQDKYTDLATMGFIAGFILMMSMDVGLN